MFNINHGVFPQIIFIILHTGRAGLIVAMSSLLAYSSIYFVERILWRVSTQERHFKQQLVTFTTNKMAEMEDIMVGFCQTD